jgi:aryl-alcohol dehydrogenase-like predicted oxidoreductase
VSALCLGAMTFGAWVNPDHDESVRIIHRALASGIKFIDTAALSDLIRAGKILYAGSSTFPAERIVEAQWAAECRDRERFRCEPPYSILVRGIEADMLPAWQRYQMGVITWGPLAGGWLSGRYRLGADLPVTSRSQRMPRGFDLSDPGSRQKLEAADKLADLAAQAGLSLIHLALAFVLSHPAVTSAIIGPRTMEQLEVQLGAPGQLRADVLDRIDEIVPPGTNLNPADRSYEPLALLDAGLRRRN